MAKLYALDGTDGSGKQTQYELLVKRLEKEGKKVFKITFPNYSKPSSSLVKMYLSGEFGQNAGSVSPYVASTFYAADRYATYKTEFEDFYKNEDGIILSDRYVSANMIHQTGKIEDNTKKDRFLEWVYDLEFNIYGIPKPDKVFFLNMPTDFAIELIKNRENKFTNGKEKDIHERDKNHLVHAYNAACYASKKFGWEEIMCVENNKLKTIEQIHEEIYKRAF